MEIILRGGRFPSNLAVNDRDSQVPLSPSSNESFGDREIVAAAGALPGSGIPFGGSGRQVQAGDDETNAIRGELGGASRLPIDENAHSSMAYQQDSNGLPGRSGASPAFANEAEYGYLPVQGQSTSSGGPGEVAHNKPPALTPRSLAHQADRHDSKYGDWMGPAAAGVGAGAIGAAGTEAYPHQQNSKDSATQEEQAGLQAVEPQQSNATLDGPKNSIEQPI